jgi:hypothetical protein
MPTPTAYRILASQLNGDNQLSRQFPVHFIYELDDPAAIILVFFQDPGSPVTWVISLDLFRDALRTKQPQGMGSVQTGPGQRAGTFQLRLAGPESAVVFVFQTISLLRLFTYLQPHIPQPRNADEFLYPETYWDEIIAGILAAG